MARGEQAPKPPQEYDSVEGSLPPPDGTERLPLPVPEPDVPLLRVLPRVPLVRARACSHGSCLCSGMKHACSHVNWLRSAMKAKDGDKSECESFGVTTGLFARKINTAVARTILSTRFASKLPHISLQSCCTWEGEYSKKIVMR